MTASAWIAPLLAMTKEERLLLWVGVLAGVLILGGAIIARLDRWRKRQMEAADDAPEQLGNFRAMYERGELTKAEYDRVLQRMAERVGAKPRPVAAASPPPAEPPANQEPPPTPSA